MHRAISNYKITKRKDRRYYVRLQDRGKGTHLWENEIRRSGDAGSSASSAGLPYPNHHVLKLGIFVSKYLLRFLKYAARFTPLMQEMCYFY